MANHKILYMQAQTKLTARPNGLFRLTDLVDNPPANLGRTFVILCNCPSHIALEKLEIMKDFFYGFDYKPFFGDSEKQRLDMLLKGINFVLGFEEEDSKLFIKEATVLSPAETLCRALLDEHQKKGIEYFKGVKAGVCKASN